MRSNPSVTEVARNFADYIDRVAYGGERFILMRGKRPVAELGPVPMGRRVRELPMLLASLPPLSLADAASLAEEMEIAREELNEDALHDPWES